MDDKAFLDLVIRLHGMRGLSGALQKPAMAKGHEAVSCRAQVIKLEDTIFMLSS